MMGRRGSCGARAVVLHRLVARLHPALEPADSRPRSALDAFPPILRSVGGPDRTHMPEQRAVAELDRRATEREASDEREGYEESNHTWSLASPWCASRSGMQRGGSWPTPSRCAPG